jgi:HK97 family phage major capsid protein
MPATATAPTKEKAYELRQKRATLLDNNRVLIEKAEKESRALSKEEQDAFDNTEKECREMEKRISTIERQIAIDSFGDDPPKRTGLLPHEDPANTKNQQHKFSMMRAIKCLAERRALDGLEAEVSQELSLRSGKSPQGFLMPLSRSQEQRDLTTSTGAGSVPTILSPDWIEMLRNSMVVKQAGAREILDLQGKFSIPRQNQASTAYWVAESGAPTGSNQTLDQVNFTPKTLGAFTDISRRFLELTILSSGEDFVKQDLSAVLARGVDNAAINGTGLTNQPLGILQNTGITTGRTVSLGAAGGAPTFNAMVALTTIVYRGNAGDLGEFAYITNADGVGTLATTPKIGTTFPVFLMENGTVYAKKVYQTQAVPNNLTKGAGTGLSAIIGGIWNQLILAYWSGIDILVDPYTGSTSGTVRVVALIDCDIQPRHNEAFGVIVDMVSNQV